MGVPHAVYVDVTSIVCRHACVKLHSDSCCSVVYERANRRCLVTPLDHNSTDTQLVQRPHTVYYKRRKCSGPTSYSLPSKVYKKRCRFLLGIFIASRPTAVVVVVVVAAAAAAAAAAHEL